MSLWHCVFPAVLGLSMCAAVHASGFTIVDGSTRAVIAVSSKPSPAESLAGSEIANYVELMSGTKLKIIQTNSAPAGAIVLTRDAKSPGDEGYSIAIDAGRLVLTGARDRSVLYAAYDLLERLGCRWLSPKYSFYGDAAEVVPKNSKLIIELDKPIVERPRLKYRKLYVEEGHTHTAENLLQMIEWMSKSRENTLVVPIDYQGSGRVKWDNWRAALIPELRKRDIQIEVGGHGYQNFIDADMPEAKDHPEWFGLNTKGKRQTGHAIVFCTSNPDAVGFLTKNVIAYLKAHPEIDIFDFWPPDCQAWCECETCMKLGTPADRQALLVGQVISEARKQGIKAKFECIAYWAYTNPPANPPMDPSVLIDFCPIGQCFEMQIDNASSPKNAEYARAIQAWKKGFKGDFSVYSYYRKYAWHSRPVIISHYMQADLRWYTKIGADGISSYSEPGDWRTYELNHYTMARLAWNPDADVDAIVNEFCAGRYPECTGPAKALLMALENTVRHGCRIPGTSPKTPAVLQGYIDGLQAARDALSKVAGDDPAASALIASTDYAIKDMAIQKKIAEDTSPADIQKLEDDLAAFLDSHKGEGVFVDR